MGIRDVFPEEVMLELRGRTGVGCGGKHVKDFSLKDQ